MAKTLMKRNARSQRRTSKPAAPPVLLKGWQQIAVFLSQPLSVAQRWAKDGMPVTRQGRYVTATPEELNKWLGQQAGAVPVRVTTPDTDLSAELKRGLAYVRAEKKGNSPGRKPQK